MGASDGANVEAFVDANVSKEAERNYITQAADCVRILPLLEFDLVLDRSPDTFAIHHLRRNGSVIGDEKKWCVSVSCHKKSKQKLLNFQCTLPGRRRNI